MQLYSRRMEGLGYIGDFPQWYSVTGYKQGDGYGAMFSTWKEAKANFLHHARYCKSHHGIYGALELRKYSDVMMKRRPGCGGRSICSLKAY